MTAVLVQQSALAQGTGDLTPTLNGVLAPNTLIALYAAQSSTVTQATVADSNGVPVLAVRNAGAGGATVIGAGCYYQDLPPAGTHIYTVHPAVTQRNSAAILMEWSGLDTTGSFDASSSANGTTAQTLNTGNTGVPAQNAELVIAAIGIGCTTGTNGIALSDPPAGFTSIAASQDTTAGKIAVEFCWAIISNGAVQSCSWNWTEATTRQSTCVIATFKIKATAPPAGGVSATYRRRHHRVVQNVAGGAAPSIFTPQAGFAGSGSNQPDGAFTLTNGSNPFGSGPTLALFDDFRGRTAGTTLQTGDVPVAGNGLTWSQATGGSGSTAHYQRLGRSLLYPALSVLDNERAGTPNPFGRVARLYFGAEFQQMYLFYAETARGTWDFRNDEGGGGGYYKRDWLFDDESAGASAYDCWLSTLLEQAVSNSTVSGITWAAGVATVTTTLPIAMPAGYGPTWTTKISNANPSTYNSGVNVTATKTGASTFTYAIASDPGAYVGSATFQDPGALQDGSNPVPAATIATVIGGNSWSAHGLPNQVFPAGDATGVSKTDNTGWNCIETGVVADVTNPSTAVGRLVCSMWNQPNKQAYAYNDNTHVLMGTASPYNSFNRLQICGLMQNLGTHTVDRTDFYLALGPNCLARFLLGDAATLATCGTIVPCTPTSWSPGSVTMTLRQGAFTAGLPGSAYLHFVDANNNPTLCGRF